MTEQEWRDNLKAGDTAIIASCHNKGFSRKVERTTPEQIIFKSERCGKEFKFWRKTGRIVGDRSGWLVQPEVTT